MRDFATQNRMVETLGHGAARVRPVRRAGTAAVSAKTARDREREAPVASGLDRIGRRNPAATHPVRTPGGIAARDPAIWSGPAALPATGDRPARLMLREFERYHTDDTIPEARGGAVRRRRVIEERLVYAVIFTI